MISHVKINLTRDLYIVNNIKIMASFGLPHIRFVRLVFSAGTVFFSHNNSARTVFFS